MALSLAAAIAAVVAQLVLSLSAHGAAWGCVVSDRRLRRAGIIDLALGICFFSLGGFAAIELAATPRRSKQSGTSESGWGRFSDLCARLA